MKLPLSVPAPIATPTNLDVVVEQNPLRRPQAPGIERSMMPDKRVELLMACITQDPGWMPAKLDSLAKQVNLSPSRLRHLFKQEVGAPPLRYRRQLQLKKAKYLFEHTFLSVKEVMANVGLNDLSHAVRDYKAIYGLTPSQTRARSSFIPRVFHPAAPEKPP